MFYSDCSHVTVTSRDQYQALRLATVVHVEIYTTTASTSIIVENFIPNLRLK